MNRVSLTSIAVLAFASVATSSAWADVNSATATSSANGWYASVLGTKTSSSNKAESDAGGFVRVADDKWGNGFVASAEATGGALKAFAATTYTRASGWTSSYSTATASFSDFITFSGGSGSSTGSFLTSLAGMLSGGKTGNAGYSLTASLCDTSSGYCWGDSQSLINDSRSFSGQSDLTVNDKFKSNFHFVFGNTYQLNTSFTANASNGGTADFSDTVHLSFNVDKGVALTSASGYQYNVAAVPEPETFAMMLSGLGMIGFIARRRRKM